MFYLAKTSLQRLHQSAEPTVKTGRRNGQLLERQWRGQLFL